LRKHLWILITSIFSKVISGVIEQELELQLLDQSKSNLVPNRSSISHWITCLKEHVSHVFKLDVSMLKK
jgi:hypothetical protein